MYFPPNDRREVLKSHNFILVVVLNCINSEIEYESVDIGTIIPIRSAWRQKIL